MTPPRERRPATAREAKALAHPLRLRILRLCGNEELTNKELADRLGRDPGTILYHVRQLSEAGFLEPAPVRTGDSGALEKPYRSTGLSWWLSDDNRMGDEPEGSMVPLDAFIEELRESGGAESIITFSRFVLHLSVEDIAELDRRIVRVLDEFVATDDERRELYPAFGGMIVMHKLAKPE